MKQLLLTAFFCYSLCTIAYSQKLPHKWNSLTDFPKEWIMLERDSIGYLIYDPCDGGTPAILIENDTLVILHQLEYEKHLIKEFVLLNKNHYLIIAYGTIDNGKVVTTDPELHIQIKVSDRKRKLVMWKWVADYRLEEKMRFINTWIMTPLHSADEFRMIDNPCPMHKIPEKTFLPVEFDIKIGGY